MTEREPIEVTNLDAYGNAALPWSRPHDILVAGPLGPETSAHLGTVRPDGRPHSAGVGALWYDGDLYVVSGPGTRKSRKLQANPACTISMRLEGIDLVFEGEASRVTDAKTLEAVAALYREGGWPAAVEGDAFTAPYSAPSAGPPPWHLYRFTFHTVFGVAAAEPWGATPGPSPQHRQVRHLRLLRHHTPRSARWARVWFRANSPWQVVDSFIEQ